MHTDTPPKIEDTHPALAELLRQVANGTHPTVKGLYFSSKGLRVTRKPIKAEQTAGRNDPCPCGSGKKFKKCCLS